MSSLAGTIKDGRVLTAGGVSELSFKILLHSLLATARSTGQGEAEGEQVEGLVPEEVPVEEEAGDL